MDRDNYYIECSPEVAERFRDHTGDLNSLLSVSAGRWYGNQLTPNEAAWLRQRGATEVTPTDDEL